MTTEGYPATTQRYDVFLSHTSGDKDVVERNARRLRAEATLEPFLHKAPCGRTLGTSTLASGAGSLGW
jgi:hypothetical protein